MINLTHVQLKLVYSFLCDIEAKQSCASPYKTGLLVDEFNNMLQRSKSLFLITTRYPVTSVPNETIDKLWEYLDVDESSLDTLLDTFHKKEHLI